VSRIIFDPTEESLDHSSRRKNFGISTKQEKCMSRLTKAIQDWTEIPGNGTYAIEIDGRVRRLRKR
jgi:hypothetical protein